jgi:hypothetical protein
MLNIQTIHPEPGIHVHEDWLDRRSADVFPPYRPHAEEILAPEGCRYTRQLTDFYFWKQDRQSTACLARV